jgi:hypothetical protein
MRTIPDAGAIIRFHDAALQRGLELPTGVGSAAPAAIPLWRWVAANHRYNRLLWQQEDRARRTDVGPAIIAASKRMIDRRNQQRNDAVEAMDEAILSLLAAQGAHPQPDARLSSETAGAMIDRLSILALKIFHMHAQSLRAEAGAAHMEACRVKLDRLTAQRLDLAGCLDQLLADAVAGRAYFKVYRQFKMYNDPALNPWLYGRSAAT